MLNVPADLKQSLKSSGQEHVLQWWEELDDSERDSLLAKLKTINLAQIQKLFQKGESKTQLPPLESLTVPEADVPGPEEKAHGEEALRKGEVAVILVAGGQGTRLGFDKAKGLYPIGAVNNTLLLQIHTEKILALGKRHGKVPPLLIMTSEATDAELKEAFEEHNYFGLNRDEVIFFSQSSLPAVSLDGKLLMEDKHRIFTSPNGHGGVLQALHDHQVLEKMKSKGIKQLFYYQVDNPLVKVPDPYFLGQHLKQDAEMSLKVVRKQRPDEPIGNFVLKDGRCDMVEYTELPKEWEVMKNDKGGLKFWAGSIAIHIFSMDFLSRMVRDFDSLPYHIAKKKVPHLNEHGETVEPGDKNALKFERFIFDVLPKAERWTLVETSHAEEFEPLKNADAAKIEESVNSPTTVRNAMTALAHQWLKAAGANVKEGVPVEISPLFALDAEELADEGEFFDHD